MEPNRTEPGLVTPPPNPAAELIEQFESAWRDGSAPTLVDFLYRAGGQTDLMLDLICADMEHRFARGERPDVETYIERVPRLGNDPDAVVGLVEWEYTLRRRHGVACDPADYGRRFPDHRDRLAGLLSRLRAGRYQLQGELGGGGMGTVYRAYDPDCERPLAVKVLLVRYQRQPAAHARFNAEAKLTAQLQHPGVPPVHEIGQLDDGRPFFAMKLIQGQTLADLLARRPSPADDRPRWLALFASVCQTMGYAHSKGVIHRDLKPANIMVGAFGEVQVMDWGLAGRFGEACAPPKEDLTPSEVSALDTAVFGPTQPTDRLTVTGQGMGTPAYMPPEQARGAWREVDARADVFSLGGLLCEILTGKPPFVGPNLDEVLRRTTQGDLAETFARLDACGADPELLDLARRCLSPSREGRPQNAGMLAEAVARYDAGVVERLRQAELDRAAAEARVGSERRAKRLTMGLAAAGVLLAVGVGAGWTWLYQQRQVKAAMLVQKRQTLAESLDAARDRYRAGEWQQAGQALSQAEGLAKDPEVGDDDRRAVEEVTDDFRVVRELEESRVQRCGMPNCAFNYDKADPAKVFASCGIDVFALPADEAAKRVRRRELIREDLVAALDDWAWVLKTSANPRKDDWGKLLDIADRADDSPRRRELRKLVQASPGQQRAELIRLAAEPGVVKEQPTTVLLLAGALEKAGEVERAIELLRQAVLKHRDNFWLHVKLAEYLSFLGRREVWNESLSHYQAALALRPNNWVVQNNIAVAHAHEGHLDRAMAELKNNLDLPLTPRFRARTMHQIGQLYHQKHDTERAARWYRDALATDPSFAPSHINLGVLVSRSNQKTALEHYLAAAKAAPRDQVSRLNLSGILLAGGQADEARRVFTEAERIGPLRPGFRLSWATRLWVAGHAAEAREQTERVLKEDPTNAPAHLLLGQLSLQQGKYAAARDALAMARKHVGQDKQLAQRLTRAEADCRRRLAAEGKFQAVLEGGNGPASPAEALLLIEMAREQGRPRLAVRLCERLFQADPKVAGDLTRQERYNAACSAAVAAAGSGAEPVSDEKEKVRLRGLALGWLRNDLAIYKQMLEKQPQAKSAVLQVLSHTLHDADFASVRGAALEKLPKLEADAWRVYWEEVAATLEKASAP